LSWSGFGFGAIARNDSGAVGSPTINEKPSIERIVPPEIDDVYRSLGRYVAEFSRMVMAMRSPMVDRLRRSDDPREVAESLFARAEAAPTAHVFFNLCKSLGNLTYAEEEVREHLNNRLIYDLIPKRNNVAHGDFLFIWWGPPHYQRLRPDAQPAIKHDATPAALDKLADEVSVMAETLSEFGQLCFGLHAMQDLALVSAMQIPDGGAHVRIGDFFVMKGPKGKRRIAREGPLAARHSYSLA
jgi:hypothetical protein